MITVPPAMEALKARLKATWMTAALDAAGQSPLRHDLEQLWAGNNCARDGSTHVEAEYLDVVAIRG